MRETALGRESGPYVELISEENGGSKIPCYCPFKSLQLRAFAIPFNEWGNRFVAMS
jgi:hypothetical protein